MEYKNLVTKSKSSNIALQTKARHSTADKKCWSSARFSNIMSKKRGMYVEKKSSNSVVAPKAQGPSDVPKVPKRPRRGNKNFLSRCLSILSQDTKETQFPEGDYPTKSKTHPRKASAETVDKGIQDMDAVYSASNSPSQRRSPRRNPAPPYTPPPKQRKPRFRSKELKENFRDNKLLLFQPKQPQRSPSISTHRSASKTMSQVRQTLERVIKNDPPTTQIEVKVEENYEQDYTKPVISTDSKFKKLLRMEDDLKKIAQDNEKSPFKTVSKSKSLSRNVSSLKNRSSEHDEVKSTRTESKSTVRKVLRIEEPSTLVSDFNAKNKSLYNLFVDLLDTTFNVYNVDSDYAHYPVSPTFEIDEKVAQKLKTQEPIHEGKTSVVNFVTLPNKNVYFRNSKQLNDLIDDNDKRIVVYEAKPNCCNWNPPPVAARKSSFRSNYRVFRNKSYNNYNRHDESDYRPNLKSQSLRYAQQLKIVAAAKSDSPIVPKKRTAYKKYKKQQTLLDILKDELKLEAGYFEEPENFHQALTFIARDKKRTWKALAFEQAHGVGFSDRRSKEAGKSDCFKRRKVISSSTKSPNKTRKMASKSSRMRALPREFSMTVVTEGAKPRKADGYSSEEPSCHSIEVKAYDYEPNQYIRRVDLANNRSLILPCSSGISLESETIMSSKEYVECLEKCGKSLSHNSSMAASTTISQLLLRDVYTLY